MNTYIGIDLGTSAVKLLLVGADGKILNEATESYPVFCPRDGWTEQNPQDWLSACFAGLERLLKGCDRSAVKGISFGGQMHGLVVLDDKDRVIRPCILWNDGRTEEQTRYLNEAVGKDRLSALTGNIAFAGFTAPKLLWLREHEPHNFEKIAKIMLPKDYLAYVLSGVFCTDCSDASGTLLFDVERRRWSQEMCELCHVKSEWLPAVYESYQTVGTLKGDVAARLGLDDCVKIIAGAGDNAAAAIGTGTLLNGDCNVSLGTSGTVFIATDNFCKDGRNALHSFCHADGKWHFLGCILSAASARKWWLEDVLQSDDYDKDEGDIRDISCGELIFLPYLNGERSPHNDVNARGAFIGISARTTRAQMSRAVMEGVAFALKDCLTAAGGTGVSPRYASLCGGGAKSREWRQIIADVLNVPVRILKTEQGPAFGAAMLAMVGCGEYATCNSAAESLIFVESTLQPQKDRADEYAAKYEKFKKLYPLLKTL